MLPRGEYAKLCEPEGPWICGFVGHRLGVLPGFPSPGSFLKWGVLSFRLIKWPRSLTINVVAGWFLRGVRGLTCQRIMFEKSYMRVEIMTGIRKVRSNDFTKIRYWINTYCRWSICLPLPNIHPGWQVRPFKLTTVIMPAHFRTLSFLVHPGSACGIRW